MNSKTSHNEPKLREIRPQALVELFFSHIRKIMGENVIGRSNGFF